MEAVPRLPMISFELKVSPDQSPVEFSKLKLYIREFYNEDPETYSAEIRNLETLRANAVRPVKDVAGCSVLKKYYCQLHFLQSRFPMGKEGAAAISFTWKDLYGGMVVQTADIKFEMVAILYNIGALHSQLGAGDDRMSPEGLKMACTHFQCAAWSFQYLKDTYHQSSLMDLSPDLMQFMYQLCLAQAQECILEKSMTDNRKATINAKVAAQIVDYYNLALNALLQGPSSDEGIIVEMVGTKNFKSWKKYMRFKASYYSCVSLLYQGMQAEEQQKMGERVSYYQGALDKLNEAIKLSKGVDHAESVAESLVFTRDVVEGKRKAARNENDFIYHEEIPELDSLPNVKGASLVNGISFSVNDPEISGPDIFARLVPMKAHEASSLYSEEKAKLLRKISAMVDSKDEELVSFMSCLQLDYIKAHLDPVILPQEVVDRCAALSAMPDAIPNLIAAMDKLNDAYHDVDTMLKEAMELIKVEEAAEKEYQELMGPRPPSIVATDLTREANKYMEAHKKAAESNETLHRAMTQHIENLRVLQQPLSEIQESLPTLASLDLGQDSSLNEVIMLVNKVGEMRRQRAMLASQLRESLCSDDITGQLVTRSDEKPEDIFVKELQKHDKYTTLIEQNLAAQENILRALTDAYASYAPTRKATAEIMRQRDMMLSALISSYDAYEDLIAKSSKGQEFYRKLETNLTKLLQRLKGTCKVQQEERETILAQNVKKAQQMADSAAATASAVAAAAAGSPSGNISAGGGGGLKLKDYLQNKKHSAVAAAAQIPPSVYYGTSGHSDTIPQQQTWLPGVRPAPVGSEGTAPVCTGSSKPTDYSSQIPAAYNSQPSAYAPTYTSQASSPYYTDPSKSYQQTQNYYYNTLYNTGLQNLQYPSISDTALSQGCHDYSQNLFGYQQGPPAAGSAYNYDHSYALPNSSQYSQNQSPSPSPSHTALNKQPTQQSSYPQQFPTTSTSVPSQNYYAQQQQPIQSQTDHAYPPSIQSTQSYTQQAQMYAQSQIYTQAPTSQSIQPHSYTLPRTQSLQPYSKEQGFAQQPSHSDQNYSQTQTTQPIYSQTLSSTQPVQTYSLSKNMPQKVTQPYSQPHTSQPQSYLDQSIQAMQAYSQTQTSQASFLQQVTQPVQSYSQSQTTQAQNIPQQDPHLIQTYSQGQISQTPQNYPQQLTQQLQPYSQAQTSVAYSTSSQVVGQDYAQISQPNNTYGMSNTADYDSHYAGQANVLPVQTSWQQYYNYYNANQPTQQEASQPFTPDYYNNSNYSSTYQQVPFQKTPGTNTSHYTRAGSKDTMLETNSSSVSPQGYTYASQYITNSQSGATTGTYPASYYAQPYGYNYSSTPTIQPASPAGSDQAAQSGTVTYMQASTAKLNTNTTFSQQPTSNVDLLAGLDFSVNEPPLQPQQPMEKMVNKVADLTITSEGQSMDTQKTPDVNIKPDPNCQNLAADKNNPEVVERPSPSKTPSKDPFSDPEVLSQFVQEVEKFEKFVEGLNCKTLNGPTQLDFKWNELQDLQDKDSHKQSISVARCYPMKNRYADILPFDSTRVELPSTKDDYINASLIKDLAFNCPNFIMTQAPLPSTYADFWTMVLEQHVELIVCLLSESQLNGEIYWAMYKTEDLVFGKIKISLQSCTVRTHWIERIMSVSDGKSNRIVIHLEFTSWPHSWLPESPAPLLNLCQETESVWSQQRGHGPMVVHCQSGVGRSGVLVVLTLLLNELRITHHLPEVLTATARLAKFRKNPLRDRSHLSFVYHCLLYHARDILMKRGILASRSSFEEMRPKTKSHTRHPSEDFLLNSLKEHQERRQSDASSTGSTTSNKPSEGDPLSQIDPLWPIKRYS